MRYIPPKQVKTPMGEDVWRPELWHGLIKTKQDDVAEQVTLDTEWVYENTTPEIRKFLRDVRNIEGKTGFVYIPEGHHTEHINFHEDAPIVEYWEGRTNNGLRRCMLDNAASGLHFLGYTRLAVLIASTMSDSKITQNPMGFLCELFQKKRSKKKENNWNIACSTKKRGCFGIHYSRIETMCFVYWEFDQLMAKQIMQSV
jgi:hypothetical protein